MKLDFNRPDWFELSAWNGHLIFAQWLIKSLKPGVLVELGTHWGNSYFNFCQTIKHHGLPTQCHAVDTWEGEHHAGIYGQDVFARVNQHNQENYQDFSTLHRTYFDDALAVFTDQSIDLLHIDGLHTYEAVRHDFETWRPKLSENAVVLFHDAAETQTDFGVWQYWDELAAQYPDQNFLFFHSHGLGVLGVGQAFPEEIQGLFAAGLEKSGQIRSFFENLNKSIIGPVKKQFLFMHNRRFDVFVDTGKGFVETQKESLELLRDKGPMKFFMNHYHGVKRISLRFSQAPRLILLESLCLVDRTERPIPVQVIGGNFTDSFVLPMGTPEKFSPTAYVFADKNPELIIDANVAEPLYLQYEFSMPGGAGAAFDLHTQHLGRTISRVNDEKFVFEAQLGSLTRLIESLQHTVDQKKQAAREKDKIISEKNQEIQAGTQALREKEGIIASRDKSLAEKNKSIAEKKRTNETLNSHLKRLETYANSYLFTGHPFRQHLISLRRAAGFFRHPQKTLSYWRNRKRILDSDLFDPVYYIENNGDLLTVPDLLFHFMMYGYKESRNPSSTFDLRFYRERYLKNESQDINPLIHYIFFGSSKGFLTLPESDSQLVSPQAEQIKAKEPEGPIHPGRGEDIKTFPELSSALSFVPRGKSSYPKVAIFAAYSRDYRVEPYVVHYLKALSKSLDAIIFWSDNYLPDQELEKIRPYVIYAFCKKHGEYDFGSYKRGFLWLKNQPWFQDVQELLFCNDSCYGPIGSFDSVMGKMENSGFDFWGITINRQFQRHIQSYFILFNRQVFIHPDFLKYLLAVKPERSVREVVLHYEVPFSEYLAARGFRFGSFLPDEIPGVDNPNLTHLPLTCVKKMGAPLFKVKAVKKRQTNQESFMELMGHIASTAPELMDCIHTDLLPHGVSKSGKTDGTKGSGRPMFSIIMPTYNRRHCIEHAIDSVLNQTWQGFELIIVDDGSTDGTGRWIKEKYSSTMDAGRIKYLKTAKSGVCKSRNLGLTHASNEWIAYLDSDNIMFPSFLATFARYMEDYSEHDTFYSSGIRSSDYAIIGQPFDYELLKKGNFIDLGGVVHKRELVDNGNGFDEQLSRLVDWELILRLFKGKTPVYIEDPLFLYNDDGGDRVTWKEAYSDAFYSIVEKHAPCLESVTTIIVSYNHAPYIRQAVEGVLSQAGIRNHRVILSDDGSRDGTCEILREYENDPRADLVNLSTRENAGVSENFKRCIMAASSKYVAVCEGDDYWINPRKLYEQINFLKQNPDCAMVFSAISVLDQNSGSMRTLKRQDCITSQKLTGADFLAHPSMNLIANFSACLFRSSLLKKLPNSLYRPRLSEIPLAFFFDHFGAIGFLKKVSSVYRQHRAGVWTGSSEKDQLESGLNTRINALNVCKDIYRDEIGQVIETYMKKISEFTQSGNP